MGKSSGTDCLAEQIGRETRLTGLGTGNGVPHQTRMPGEVHPEGIALGIRSVGQQLPRRRLTTHHVERVAKHGPSQGFLPRDLCSHPRRQGPTIDRDRLGERQHRQRITLAISHSSQAI